MKTKIAGLMIICFLALLLPNCVSQRPAKKLQPPPPKASPPEQSLETIKNHLARKYTAMYPSQWGEAIPGVLSRVNTNQRIIAITFDACGGKHGSGYDSKLLDFLIRERVAATLFVNARWIDANKKTFMSLAKNPLFEIENHGFKHKPLSINGRSVYDIIGTRNIGEVVEEVLVNQRKIKNLTGREPKYFRSGTAYYDNISVKIVHDLGVKVIGYNVLGDAGATYSKAQVFKATLRALPGSIILYHMNHPEKDTAEGLIKAIPELKRRGYTFVKLEDYNKFLK